jgi:hypothetical protein
VLTKSWEIIPSINTAVIKITAKEDRLTKAPHIATIGEEEAITEVVVR